MRHTYATAIRLLTLEFRDLVSAAPGTRPPLCTTSFPVPWPTSPWRTAHTWGSDGLATVTAVVRRELPNLPESHPPTSPSPCTYVTLRNTGRTRRPPAQQRLPI
jgi:hypothetical protein